MFRRKEETAAEMAGNTAQTASAPATASAGSSAAAPARNDAPASSLSYSEGAPVASGQASPSAGGASANGASSNTPYVPSARPIAAVSEPARAGAAAAPQAPSYRPTPIAEFNRGAARTTPDAMRSPTAGNGASSFGTTPEKAAGIKSNRRVLTVGNDILLKGEIATCDRLVIEGRVEAKLSEVHTVEIAECGSFKGTAEVEDAEISGVFEGDLVVRNRLVIYATGEVRGNISYGEIEIERGGRLTGQIKTVAASAKAANGKAFDASATADKRPAAKESAAA